MEKQLISVYPTHSAYWILTSTFALSLPPTSPFSGIGAETLENVRVVTAPPPPPEAEVAPKELSDGIRKFPKACTVYDGASACYLCVLLGSGIMGTCEGSGLSVL